MIKRLIDTDREIGVSNQWLDGGLRHFAFLPKVPTEKGIDTEYSRADALIMLIGARMLESGFPQRAVIRLMRRLHATIQDLSQRLFTINHARRKPFAFLVLPAGAHAELSHHKSGEIANICRSPKDLLNLCERFAPTGEPLLVVELAHSSRKLLGALNAAPIVKRGRRPKSH